MIKRSFLGLVLLLTVVGAVVWAGEQPELALKGYCPVAYAAMGKAVKGNPAISSTHQGRTYRFLNADAKAMFEQAPEKYLPAYDGNCATAVAQGMKLASDPKLFKVVGGRTYLFSNKQALEMFEKDPAGTIAMADARWQELRQTE